MHLARPARHFPFGKFNDLNFFETWSCFTVLTRASGRPGVDYGGRRADAADIGGALGAEAGVRLASGPRSSTEPAGGSSCRRARGGPRHRDEAVEREGQRRLLSLPVLCQGSDMRPRKHVASCWITSA